jgi:hypothetical protein
LCSSTSQTWSLQHLTASFPLHFICVLHLCRGGSMGACVHPPQGLLLLCLLKLGLHLAGSMWLVVLGCSPGLLLVSPTPSGSPSLALLCPPYHAEGVEATGQAQAIHPGGRAHHGSHKSFPLHLHEPCAFKFDCWLAQHRFDLNASMISTTISFSYSNPFESPPPKTQTLFLIPLKPQPHALCFCRFGFGSDPLWLTR